jgi:hypothetical protein
VYGEGLRREHRRLDAREQLRTGHDMFASMGGGAPSGTYWRPASARKRTVETRDDLAAHEPEVARLALERLSNPEIGARLLNQPAYPRVSPAQRLEQAGRQLTQPAPAGASAGTEHRRRGSECEAAAGSRLVLDAYYKQTRVET